MKNPLTFVIFCAAFVFAARPVAALEALKAESGESPAARSAGSRSVATTGALKAVEKTARIKYAFGPGPDDFLVYDEGQFKILATLDISQVPQPFSTAAVFKLKLGALDRGVLISDDPNYQQDLAKGELHFAVDAFTDDPYFSSVHIKLAPFVQNGEYSLKIDIKFTGPHGGSPTGMKITIAGFYRGDVINPSNNEGYYLRGEDLLLQPSGKLISSVKAATISFANVQADLQVPNSGSVKTTPLFLFKGVLSKVGLVYATPK